MRLNDKKKSRMNEMNKYIWENSREDNINFCWWQSIRHILSISEMRNDQYGTDLHICDEWIDPRPSEDII